MRLLHQNKKKFVTEYVKEKDNRQSILKQKQQSALKSNNTMITLNELYAMQNEVKLVKVPKIGDKYGENSCIWDDG